MDILAQGKLVPITLKYVNVKTKGGMDYPVVVDPAPKGSTVEDMEKKYGDKIKSLTTHWAVPSWKENNDILRQCLTIDPYNGNKTLDDITYNSLCLEKFLRAWDLKDDAGNAVPVNKTTIDSMNYFIARKLIDMFTDYTIPTDEAVGN